METIGDGYEVLVVSNEWVPSRDNSPSITTILQLPPSTTTTTTSTAATTATTTTTSGTIGELTRDQGPYKHVCERVCVCVCARACVCVK